MKRVLLCTLAFACVAASQATVLIFETEQGSTLGQLDVAPGSGYGDRVASVTQDGFRYGAAGGFTPNVLVAYGGLSSTPSGWATGYGDLVNVIWGNGPSTGTNTYSITLSADAGWFVRLRRFDAASWASSQPSSFISIRNASGQQVFSFSGPLEENTSTPFDFGAGLVDTSLTIEISQGWWHALDNIEFSQDVVPEPATMAILGLAAAGLAARRRKS